MAATKITAISDSLVLSMDVKAYDWVWKKVVQFRVGTLATLQLNSSSRCTASLQVASSA